MRVHRLEIAAFGPFAGTEVVDFDQLSEAGMFLLTGQTGAGKTTILDAVCFGLFGTVPGARNGAKDLKSHHAGPDDVPTVELEVTLRGRRFRTRRSPAWTRPSRRARSGYVEQHAKATIEEQVDGHWVALSNRVDDVSLLVTRVLGMNSDQFCQVVMLPQGLFQTFLQAGAKDRHDVLESLFETRRFGRIEAWLAEHRRDCDRAVEVQRSTICQLLARAEEASGRMGNGLESAIDVDDLQTARQALVQIAEQTAAAAFISRQEEVRATSQLKQARHGLDAARDLDARQQRHRAGRERLRELDALHDVVVRRTAQVKRAEAARSFSVLLDLLAAAEHKLGAARHRVVTASEAHAGRGDALAARGRLARLEAVLGVEAAIDRLTKQVDETTSQLAVVTSRRDAQREAAEELPALLADARTQLLAQSDLAGTVLAAEATLKRAQTHLAASRDAGKIATELADLAPRIAAALADRLDARTTWLDLREERLQGMAAELARQLSDGEACLVCGSRSHPSPAAPHGQLVSPEVEAAALDVVHGHEREHDRLVTSAAVLQAGLAGLIALSGGLEPDEAEHGLRRARAAFDAAKHAEGARDVLSEQITQLDERRQHIEGDLHELDTACALLGHGLVAQQRDLDEATAELSGVVAPGQRLDVIIDEARQTLSAALELSDAVLDHDRLAESYVEVEVRLATALGESDFSDVHDLRAAALSSADIAAADALNRAYDGDAREATRIVEDPVLLAAASVAVPDIAGHESLVDEAELLRAGARATADRLAGGRERLDELLNQVDQALSTWGPLVERRDLAASVAAMCAGTAAENLTRTRLSHYVLAARLAQVVAAANLRLAGIFGGRYQLEHSMQRGVGDSRGGLGLLVLDTYTGQRRDPATLSGGETFYVSLALALGLADLVRDEVGGAELSTLFVDEGFGSLDTQTLDEVMDEIDSLRSGGRCVGLVSHLSELSTRIPTQLHVRAGRAGSTIVAR